MNGKWKNLLKLFLYQEANSQQQGLYDCLLMPNNETLFQHSLGTKRSHKMSVRGKMERRGLRGPGKQESSGMTQPRCQLRDSQRLAARGQPDAS